jgi:transcriptional regulator of acetoin/glycerol metabolism
MYLRKVNSEVSASSVPESSPPQLAVALSSPADIDSAAHELVRLRDRYHTDGTTLGGLRERIVRSWERCRELRVDPSRMRAAVRDELRGANERLLRAADLMLARLAHLFADTGYAIVVTDAQGCVLDLAGDPHHPSHPTGFYLDPGSDWSEASIGTNAVGTAIADGRAMQLLSGEHYCEAGLPFTCTAAPIRAHGTREIVGVLDISGAYRLLRPHLLAVVMEAAMEIEEELAHL